MKNVCLTISGWWFEPAGCRRLLLLLLVLLLRRSRCCCITAHDALDELLQRQHVFAVNEIKLQREYHEVLEARVEVRSHSKRRDVVEVRVVDVSEYTEEPFEDESANVVEAVAERLARTLWEE